MSLRARLVLLVAASLLPLLALSLWLQYVDYHNTVENTGRQTLDLARSVARQLEQELQSRISALQVLAQSRVLRLDNDLTRFRDRAVDMSQELFGGENVGLLRPDGQVLMSTLTPIGHLLPVRPNLGSIRQVVATGQPAVSGVFHGQLAGGYVVAIDVPVRGPDGTIIAILSMSPRADIFSDFLRRQRLPSGWVAAVFDADGITVGRTPNPEPFVGGAPTERLRGPLLERDEGIVRGSLSRDGIDVLAVFARTDRFGWAVAIGIPTTELIGPAVDKALQTLGLSAILLMLCAALASVSSQQILGPIGELRRLAGLGHALPEMARTGLRETDEVADALRQADEQRRRSERSFRYLFESSPLPMWVYDPQTLLFIAVNDAAVDAFGYSRDALEAIKVTDVMPPEEAARVAEAVRPTPRRLHGKGYHVRCKDGRVIDIETFSDAITFDGHVARVVVLLDVTARTAAEEQLRQSQKMEAVGQLTGGMAHDFNNLLAVIIGNLDLLSDGGPGDPEFATFVAEATTAARRGAELTQSLLAFARRQPLRPTSVALDTLVANTTALLRRTLGEQIEVVLELQADVWRSVVDANRLEAALINLATNARDAMPKGGRLRIATRNQQLDGDYAESHAEVQPGDYVVLEVSDSGTGMPPEIVSRIFEPFFTTKARGEGTGLGLSMVFGFIKQSGGHINVYSEPGVGTTFRLYLPRDPTPDDTRDTAAGAVVPLGNGETVLVVEDDPAVRRVVMRQLYQLGYRVEEAHNAVEALRLLESRRPIDLLFTDVVMAGRVDGFDLSRIVAERWPAIRIILTSGFPDAHAGAPATARLPLLSKPYGKTDLARLLHETLRSRVDDRV